MAPPIIVCRDSCFTRGPFLTADPFPISLSIPSSSFARACARPSSARGWALLIVFPRISFSSNNNPSSEKAERDEDATVVNERGVIGSSRPEDLPPSTGAPSQQKLPHKTPRPRPRPRGLPSFLQDLVGNMPPREKGDIRDVILMSLSFAVYVYISQKLVCAYCVWQSVGRHF